MTNIYSKSLQIPYSILKNNNSYDVIMPHISHMSDKMILDIIDNVNNIVENITLFCEVGEEPEFININNTLDNVIISYEDHGMSITTRFKLDENARRHFISNIDKSFEIYEIDTTPIIYQKLIKI